MSEAIKTRIYVDDKQLVNYINAVTREEKRTLKKAYQQAIKPIINETRKNIRSSSYKIKGNKGGGLIKGVRGGAWKNSEGASAYIRTPKDNYYKLLFFEGGTKERFVVRRKGKKLKTKASRGHIAGGWFFRQALAKHVNKMGERFDEVLRQMIEKAERK